MFPSDCKWIKTSGGALLVSPGHGTFCAIQEAEMEHLEALVRGQSDGIPDPLHTRLEEHGFFAEPRPFRPKWHLLQFQVTNACNLRCRYCAADSGCARSQEISLDDVKRTIDEAVAIDPDITISFTGGEPLIVPWLFDAMDYAKAHTHKDIGLLSNLCLLKNRPDLADRIAAYIRDGADVLMSMSGADRTVCDELSGRPCFDDAIAVLDMLAERGAYPKLDVMLSAADARANVDAFAALRRRLPKEVHISVGTLYPCGRETGEHVFATEDDVQSVLDEITFEGGVSIAAPMSEKKTCRRKACQCVEYENIYVRSDGAIFSCFKLIEQYGHISEGLATVMERRRAQRVLAKNLAMCKDCPLVSLCAGGCRADNIILEKSVRAPVCGAWRRQVIAEMLFEDKPYVLDWHAMHQFAEAKKRGIKTPPFVICGMDNSMA